MAVTQPAALPPKLQQLLATLPDIDKVALLALAHRYKMDLDDPGFLPLLLTQQGIAALDKAKAELVQEIERSLDFVANKVASVGREEETRLLRFNDRLAGVLQQTSAEAEARMKQALAGWAARALDDALDRAIRSRANAAADAAVAEIDAAASAFLQKTEAAAEKAQLINNATAATLQNAREAVGGLRPAWLLAVFAAGATAGALAAIALN